MCLSVPSILGAGRLFLNLWVGPPTRSITAAIVLSWKGMRNHRFFAFRISRLDFKLIWVPQDYCIRPSVADSSLVDVYRGSHTRVVINFCLSAPLNMNSHQIIGINLVIPFSLAVSSLNIWPPFSPCCYDEQQQNYNSAAGTAIMATLLFLHKTYAFHLNLSSASAPGSISPNTPPWTRARDEVHGFSRCLRHGLRRGGQCQAVSQYHGGSSTRATEFGFPSAVGNQPE